MWRGARCCRRSVDHGRIHPLGHLPQPAARRPLDGVVIALRVAFVGGGVVGLILLAMRVSPLPWLRRIVVVYVEIFQGTPLLMQLFLAFFGLPLLGVDVSPWVAAAVTLTPLLASARIWPISGAVA